MSGFRTVAFLTVAMANIAVNADRGTGNALAMPPTATIRTVGSTRRLMMTATSLTSQKIGFPTARTTTTAFPSNTTLPLDVHTLVKSLFTHSSIVLYTVSLAHQGLTNMAHTHSTNTQATVDRIKTMFPDAVVTVVEPRYITVSNDVVLSAISKAQSDVVKGYLLSLLTI